MTVQVTVTELPARHQQLLEALLEDHRKVLSTTNGIPHPVTSSSIVAIHPLEAAIQVFWNVTVSQCDMLLVMMPFAPGSCPLDHLTVYCKLK